MTLSLTLRHIIGCCFAGVAVWALIGAVLWKVLL